MKVNEIIKEVDKCIKQLIRTFKENPTIFLTERDIQAYLYSFLIGNKKLSKVKVNAKSKWLTKKSITSLIHTEVRFKGKREDVTIVYPKKSVNVHDYETLIGIEIKFNMQYPMRKNSSMKKDIRSLAKDDRGYLIWLNWAKPISDVHIKRAKNMIKKKRKVKLYYCDVHSDTIKCNI